MNAPTQTYTTVMRMPFAQTQEEITLADAGKVTLETASRASVSI